MARLRLLTRLVPAALVAAGLTVPGAAAEVAAPKAPPVPILTYHHVGGAAPTGARNPALWVRARDFERQVDPLARAGSGAVSLARVWRAWQGGPALPRRPIVLSFDDGYPGQYPSAARILHARHWPGV